MKTGGLAAGRVCSGVPSDAQLVAALRCGDEGAFDALVDRHASALLGVAIFRLLDELLATRGTEGGTAAAGVPALATLPAARRAVVTLRDIEGWPALGALP